MARCNGCIHENVCNRDIGHGYSVCPHYTTADVVPKSEVIEEFANRLKEKLYTVPTVYNAHFRKMVDDTVTEMKGVGE